MKISPRINRGNNSHVVATFSERLAQRKFGKHRRVYSKKNRASLGTLIDILLKIINNKKTLDRGRTQSAILEDHLAAIIINITIHESIDGEQREKWLSKIREAIATQQMVNFNYPLYIQDTSDSDGATYVDDEARQTQEIWVDASISSGSHMFQVSQDSPILGTGDLPQRKQVEPEKNEVVNSLQETQGLAEKIAEINPNLVYIYDLRKKANVYVNRALQETLGYSATELLELLHPDDRERIQKHYQKCAALKNSQILEIEYRLKDSQNKWRWFYSRDTVFSRDEQGVPEQILGTAADITSRKQAEEQLQQANERLRCWVEELEVRNQDMALLAELSDFLQACLTLDEAYSAIATLVQPMFPHSSGAVYLINSANNLVEEVNHWGPVAIGETLFVPHECWALRRGRSHWADGHSGLICQHIHHGRSPMESLCVPMMAQGKSLGLLVLANQQPSQLSSVKQQLARTVAEQVSLALGNLKLRETLHQSSIRDSLTGLLNRRYLEEFLERELSRARARQEPIGCLILSVDRFQHLNRIFGHEAGDLVLRKLGHVLHGQIRNAEIASRYSGEEFAVILPGSSVSDSRNRGEELRQEIQTLSLQHWKQPLVGITVSIGVAGFPDRGDTYQELFRSAEAALYRAKALGRDRVVIAEL